MTVSRNIICVFGGLLLVFGRVSAQNNSITTNVLGYFNKFLSNEVTSQVSGSNISLSYERKLDSSRYSFTGQINYGHTLFSASSGINPKEYIELNTYRGSSIILGLRYYPYSNKNLIESAIKKNKILKGLFIGTYCGLMHLDEHFYTNFIPYTGIKYPDFRVYDSSKIWVYGIGLVGGYKFVAFDKIVLEGLVGLPYGWTSENSTMNLTEKYRKLRFLNLIKIELSIGVQF